jgi:pyrroline-5-carboxylate reductase
MRVGIIGGGNMGLAYARSLVRKNLVETNALYLYESFPERVLFLKDLKIGVLKPQLDAEIGKMDIIILAVKPQSFSDMAAELMPLLNEKTVLISIMAGVRRSIITEKLNNNKIVRVMPNTPCQNGVGATGFHLYDGITEETKTIVHKILASTGLCEEVKDEDDIDSVTALSGSGPAYIYIFAQAMTEAGKKMGLTEKSSKKLTLQTIKGALNLMETSDKNFEELIAAVKSKGGTTEAALLNFEQNKFSDIVNESLQKAKVRAKELSDLIA